MLLRQQGAYERQLLDLHRVVRVQSDIICSITKQDGVDSKDDGATDARNFREKSKSPDSDQSKELKLGVKSTQGSGAGSGDGSGQGSGGGSGQGSGSDVSDGDKGPIRRPILKGRRSPRGGGKNKRATISPEVDKIESRGGQDNGARVVHTHTTETEEGDGTHHAAATEAAPREEAEAGGARAAPELMRTSHSPKRLETRTSRTQTLQTQTHSPQTRTHLQPKTRTHLPKGPSSRRTALSRLSSPSWRSRLSSSKPRRRLSTSNRCNLIKRTRWPPGRGARRAAAKP